MKKLRYLCVLLSALMLTGCGAGSGAESGASYAPSEDKRLVVYTSHKEEVWRPIVLEFEERTGIWVDVVTGGSNELLERIASESDAPAADVMFGGGVDTIEVYRDCLEPYVSPEMAAIPEIYHSPDGVWTPFSVLPVVLIYNTKLIDSGAITGWSDLLQSGYRGKIAFADPNVSGSCFTSLMTLLQAVGGDVDDTLLAFADNLGGLELDSSGDVLTAVANGSCWVGITLEETALKRRDAGDSIDLIYPDDGTSLVPDGTAIVKGAAHMENAQRFIDFTVGRDVQQLLSGLYRRSVRSDVEPGALPELSQLKVLDYDIPWASAHHDEVLMSWAFYLDREERS